MEREIIEAGISSDKGLWYCIWKPTVSREEWCAKVQSFVRDLQYSLGPDYAPYLNGFDGHVSFAEENNIFGTIPGIDFLARDGTVPDIPKDVTVIISTNYAEFVFRTTKCHLSLKEEIMMASHMDLRPHVLSISELVASTSSGDVPREAIECLCDEVMEKYLELPIL